MKAIKFLCTFLLGFILSATTGATIASAAGFSPAAGFVAGTTLSIVGGAILPTNVFCATVFNEVWTGEMIKAFRTAVESLGWYARIRSYDQYVENDVIHFTELGGDPNVLVNCTTYPLGIASLDDADKPVSLDKFDTEATPVTDDELYACSYDKMASVQERHKDAILERKMQKAIHSLAPSAHNATTAPVLLTTGAADDSGTRLKMTATDLLAMKRKFDAMGVPKTDRILVLCSDHVNDLLETEQSFKEHYNINQTDGKITRLYGFDIYEYDGTPSYTVSTKAEVAFGTASNASTDRQASVAFYAGRTMRADGSLSFYHSEAKSDPLYHRNLVNFRSYGVCLPLGSKCTMAMVSDIPTT